MLFDYLLQFYWPGGQGRGAKPAPGPEPRPGPAPVIPARAVTTHYVRGSLGALNLVIALGVCVLLAYTASAFGAVRMADQRDLVFDRLGAQQGLSQLGVTAIAQDQQGFIWVGTQEGLYRYDGYSFETFYHLDDDPGSLLHDQIRDIFPDSKGNLWVGTDAGLNRYDPHTGKFDVYSLVPDGDGQGVTKVLSLFEDRSGTLWVGTDTGLFEMRPNGALSGFVHDASDAASIGRGSVWAVFEDSQGTLWVGTELGGLSRLNADRLTFSRYDTSNNAISDNHVRAIVEQSGKLWVATFNGGISIFDPTTGHSRAIVAQPLEADQLGSNRVRALLSDQHGNIWVGSDFGLHLWHPDSQNFTRYVHDATDAHSLANNNVLELFQDRGGVVWVGTFNGLAKWNANIETFPHFKQNGRGAQGLSSNEITSFEETDNGDVWVGTYGGLNRWKPTAERFDLLLTKRDGLAEDVVMSLASRGNELWVGTFSSGVSLVRDGRVEATFAHDPADATSISANAITSILVDDRGNVWFSTWGGGVNRYLGEGRFKRYPEAHNPRGQFSNLHAVDMEQAPDGRIWIATDGGGVVILNAESGETEILRAVSADPHSLSSDHAITLAYVAGAMWVGTNDSGLNRFLPEQGQFQHITKGVGLASDKVFGILEDDRGHLWISGSKGLSMLDPRTGQIAAYDSTHGLQSNDFNSGAYLRLSDGSFLFGGNHGFNAFDPARIKGNTYVPPIVVTEFSKFNEPFSLPTPVYQSDGIELNYKDFVIGFEFSAMDFTAPEKNRFRYMLQGFDRDWVDAKSGTHQVTYTNLDSGDYQFRVLGSNNDGVWNETGTTINVTVNPPLWATWWAYLVYLGLGIGAFYQVQKANERRLRRETEKRYSERLQLYIESLEEATDCVLIADANKNLMYANNAIASILGLSPAEAVGRPILSLLFNSPEDAELAQDGLRTVGRWHGEVGTRRGTVKMSTDITIAAVRDDMENETAYVSIARDITDRKRIQAELDNIRRNLELMVDQRTEALDREIAENKAVQRQLANSLKEKELLLKEVHHRVKNNMQVISSLLNIQAESIDDKVFSNLLGESQQRIKSMSLIHENLYQSENLLEINFDDYINMLANSLCRFYRTPGVNVNLDIKVDNVNLDIETAVPCGLIINELISNSLKHAFQNRNGCGTIAVAFRAIGCRYVLRISDDGIGLPADFDPSSASSMGMEIVSILTQQLDGRLHAESKVGALFEISFPRKEKAVV